MNYTVSAKVTDSIQHLFRVTALPSCCLIFPTRSPLIWKICICSTSRSYIDVCVVFVVNWILFSSIDPFTSYFVYMNSSHLISFELIWSCAYPVTEFMEVLLQFLDECCTKGVCNEAHLIDPKAYGKIAVGIQDMVCRVRETMMPRFISYLIVNCIFSLYLFVSV